MKPYYENDLTTIYNGDCLDVMDYLIEQGVKVDLIMTDPPYLIENTNPGGNCDFANSLKGVNKELDEGTLTEGIDNSYLERMVKLQDKINIYIWCNHKQITQYLDFFVKKHNCKFDIIIWNKTNSPPTFNNKYLTDKEYCFYFRKGGYCNPNSYNSAKTVYNIPINIKDKRKYGHPTIKPLSIITNLILNSTKENHIVLDCFAGSFTTSYACEQLNRNNIGIELEKKYCDIGVERLSKLQLRLDI